MKRNAALENLSKTLGGKGPNYGKVAEAVKGLREQYSLTGKRVEYATLLGIAGEFHAFNSLATLSCMEGNPYRIQMEHGINDMEETENYRFRRRQYNRILVDKRDAGSYTDYDVVALVDGLLTVFEVKTQKGRGTSDKNPLSNSKLSYQLSEEGIRRKLNPVMEYAGEDVGYVVMMRPDIVKGRVGIRQRFEEAGGILIPICPDFSRFEGEVRKLLAE